MIKAQMGAYSVENTVGRHIPWKILFFFFNTMLRRSSWNKSQLNILYIHSLSWTLNFPQNYKKSIWALLDWKDYIFPSTKIIGSTHALIYLCFLNVNTTANSNCLFLLCCIISQVLTYVTCGAATFGHLSVHTRKESIFSFHYVVKTDHW